MQAPGEMDQDELGALLDDSIEFMGERDRDSMGPADIAQMGVLAARAQRPIPAFELLSRAARLVGSGGRSTGLLRVALEASGMLASVRGDDELAEAFESASEDDRDEQLLMIGRAQAYLEAIRRDRGAHRE